MAEDARLPAEAIVEEVSRVQSLIYEHEEPSE
jgi:hypothetical protein